MRRIARGAFLLIVIPVAVAVLSAIAIATWEGFTSEEKPRRTAIRLFNSQAPAPGRISETVECFPYSVVNPGVGEAHRCEGPRDPCWGPMGTEHRLVCVYSPWDEKAETVRVDRWTVWDKRAGRERTFDPIMNAEDRKMILEPPPFRQSRPWALELSNGARCVFTTGATFVVAGERGNYFCRSEDEADRAVDNDGWVIGVPDRRAPLWRALFAESRAARSFTEVEVYVAWY